MYPSILAEWQKAKGSMALWLAVLGTVFNVFLFAGVALVQHPPDLNWSAYLAIHYQGISTMMLPLFVIILCSLVHDLEHRNGHWELLQTSPVAPGALYLSKWIFMLQLFVVAHIVFVLGLLGTGFALGWLIDDFIALRQKPDWSELLQLIGLTIASVLGILSVHHWLSLAFSRFIVPLTIGILGFVVTLLLQNGGWDYLWLLPYAPPLEYVRYWEQLPQPTWLGIYSGIWVSFGYGALALIGGYFWFLRRW
jgi:hypothetical protein